MFCVTITVLTSYQVSFWRHGTFLCLTEKSSQNLLSILSRSILLDVARIAAGHSACSPNYCHGRCWYVFASWWVKCLSCQTWRCWSCRCLASILRHKRWYTHENQETKRPKTKTAAPTCSKQLLTKLLQEQNHPPVKHNIAQHETEQTIFTQTL